MAKKALCVGINTYSAGQQNGHTSDLKGCVNDANAWGNLLKGHFDFSAADIDLVLEQDATKKRMVEGLKNLLHGTAAGDQLVYTFSGHGTYRAAKSNNQLDYDQAQCPADFPENLLLDNELRELFYNLPAGVQLTVISDSCYSGSVTRKGQEEMNNVRLFESHLQADEVDPLAPLSGPQLPRHLPPSLFGGDELNEVEFNSAYELSLIHI